MLTITNHNLLKSFIGIPQKRQYFDGNGMVKTIDNNFKLVSDLKQYDMIINSDNHITQIKYCVRYNIYNYPIHMVKLNDAFVTPLSLVRPDNEWNYAIKFSYPRRISTKYIYNFVLTNCDFITINDLDCATIGNGYKLKIWSNYSDYIKQKVMSCQT